LPDTSLVRAGQAAARIQSLLADIERPCCTISIGIACQSAGDESLDSLLARADVALYRAKENGRDRIEVAEAAALVA